jgi:hypothetical protein
MFFLFYGLFAAVRITLWVCWVILALVAWMLVALVCLCTRSRAPRLHRFIDSI